MVTLSMRVGIVIFLLSAVVVTMGCETREEQVEALKNTDITLRSIEINEIGTEVIDLNVTLDIYNPNNVTARLERMNYTVYANDVRLGSGSFEEPLEIPPEEGRRTSTNFIAQTTSVSSAALSALQEGGVLWSVEGIAYIDTPLGTIEQSFSVNISEAEDNTGSENISGSENSTTSAGNISGN